MIKTVDLPQILKGEHARRRSAPIVTHPALAENTEPANKRVTKPTKKLLNSDKKEKTDKLEMQQETKTWSTRQTNVQ